MTSKRVTVFHFIKLVIKGKSVANMIFEKSLQGVRWMLLGPHSLWVPEGLLLGSALP